jgi:rhodanese-related sulfurtransferase
MPRKTSSRRNIEYPLSKFLRRPLVQIGLVVIAAIIVVLIALNGGQPASSPAAEISVQEAYKIYQEGNAYFLDVREPSEWAEYHAPNSTLIPLGELAARVNELPKDKQIVVVCRSGNRSQEGRDLLKRAGFTNVTSMAGGLKTWRDSGYPVQP